MRLKRFLYITLVVLWCFAPDFSCAETSGGKHITSIAVILSSDSSEYKSVFDSFSKSLQTSVDESPVITVLLPEDFNKQKKLPYDLLIAVGTTASRTAAMYGDDIPILSIFIPKKNFNELPVNKTTKISAIVIDQPVSRYVELCSLVLNDSMKKLGVFYNGNAKIRDHIIREASAKGFEPVLEIVKGPITARHISRLINISDAILLIPGIADISPQRAKWLLYMAYRERVPVIAFSEAYIKAGALAAIATSPEDVGRQAADYLGDLLNLNDPGRFFNGRITYPDSYSVYVNRKIADQMAIAIPASEILEEQIGRNADSNKKKFDNGN